MRSEEKQKKYENYWRIHVTATRKTETKNIGQLNQKFEYLEVLYKKLNKIYKSAVLENNIDQFNYLYKKLYKLSIDPKLRSIENYETKLSVIDPRLFKIYKNIFKLQRSVNEYFKENNLIKPKRSEIYN